MALVLVLANKDEYKQINSKECENVTIRKMTLVRACVSKEGSESGRWAVQV